MGVKRERIEAIVIDILLFSFFLTSLIYCFHYRVTPLEENNTKISNKNFSLLGPYAPSVIADDNYEELFNVKNFSFIINSKQCKNYTAGLLLLVVVVSDPRNYERRNAIRNTWGQNLDSTKIVYFFGETPDEVLTEQIQNESMKYGDIVQGNFVDAYRNMTYKHIMALKWASHHCSTAKYVLKTDDDVLVDAIELRRYLAKELSPWGARDLIACQALNHTQPIRFPSKWFVSREEYATDYYPRYCAGWAILYSRDVVSKLIISSQTVPYFWIDDVYVTGICAEKIGVPRIRIPKLILRDYIPVIMQKWSEYAGTFVLGPFNVRPAKMIELWNAMPNNLRQQNTTLVK